MTPLLMSLVLTVTAAPDAGTGPPTHCDHHAPVDARGDQAMGFSHEMTAHHFVLTASGGFISANALSAADSSTRTSIRQHMSHIASAFAQDDFDMPMFVHDTMPPGVETMKRLHAQIQYTEEPTDLGARVAIHTTNAEALQAIHAFLRFQITEHCTGDSTAISHESACPLLAFSAHESAQRSSARLEPAPSGRQRGRAPFSDARHPPL